MVAFGAKIEDGKSTSHFPPEMFLDYTTLKSRLYELEHYNLRAPIEENAMSLSVPPATNAAGMPVHTFNKTPKITDDDSDDEEVLSSIDPSKLSNFSHDDFIAALDSELKKMDKFAHAQVVLVRKALRELEAQTMLPVTAETKVDGAFTAKLQDAEANFLAVEQYVNLNVTGVRKLLKKHDKLLSGRPIMGFVMAKMHDMRWVRNDYSDVVVRISRLYASQIAGADKPAHDFNSEQNFVRTTSKFWVRNEDLSAVKLAISRRLPVYLQPTYEPVPATGVIRRSGTKDSQLVNSVYLDNAALELYHGRLDKTAGAVALRLRWYGTGEPTLVFVERKTHREGWTGQDSVKERFSITPEEVHNLLMGKYDAEAHEKRSKKSGKKDEAAVRAERQLMDEVTSLIKTKHLVPTMRSQCTRVAFQLASTNAVRVSMDSNLCLISEQSAIKSDRWYRDPSKNIPLNEITRFPFAVLEVKLALSEEDELPDWVRTLVESDKLIAVHKFSKFTHGCAVLMPDEVQAMPYWIDDPAIAASIKASGGASILRPQGYIGPDALHAPTAVAAVKKLQASQRSRSMRARTAKAAAAERAAETNNTNSGQKQRFFRRGGSSGAEASCCNPLLLAASGGGKEPLARGEEDGPTPCCNPLEGNEGGLDGMQKLVPPQKIEPKLVFAAERTMLHWLHNAVILASFGVGGLAAASARQGYSEAADFRGKCYSVALCLFACVITAYALRIFHLRTKLILSATPTEWGDPLGPLIIGIATMTMLTLAWIIELVNYASTPTNI